jgi:hypothetical protein
MVPDQEEGGMGLTSTEPSLFPAGPLERWTSNRSECGRHWRRVWLLFAADGYSMRCIEIHRWAWDAAGWEVEYSTHSRMSQQRAQERDRGEWPRRRVWRFGLDQAAAELCAERLETLIDRHLLTPTRPG